MKTVLTVQEGTKSDIGRRRASHATMGMVTVVFLLCGAPLFPGVVALFRWHDMALSVFLLRTEESQLGKLGKAI
jgi:hypothetical protein